MSNSANPSPKQPLSYNTHYSHESHSKTLSHEWPYTLKLATANGKPLKLDMNAHTHNDTNESLNLSLDINVSSHVSDHSNDSFSDYTHLQSYRSPHSNPISSPSHSLLLHQSVTSLPTLNLNDSKTTEENVLCALDPIPHKPKPKLLREAAKSEPPYPASHECKQSQNHNKSSKSMHMQLTNVPTYLRHITSQPPPMPAYIHNRHTNHTSVTSIGSLNSASSVKLSQNLTPKRRTSKNKVRFEETNPKPKLVRAHEMKPSKSAQSPSKHSKKNRKKKFVKRSETPQPIYSNKVHVMRDKEVLQIDEEIPIEKFIHALKKGYARIMTENEQNEEYNKSARIARSVSVGNMQAYKDEILAEQELQRVNQRKQRHKKRRNHKHKKRHKRHKLSQSNKNTPKNKKKCRATRAQSKSPNWNRFEFDSKSMSIPPKLSQGVENSSDSDTDSDSDSSDSLDLLDPPKEIECKPKRNLKIKRSTTAENKSKNKNKSKSKNTLRTRSRTVQSRSTRTVKKMSQFPNANVRRVRNRPNANGHFRKNKRLPSQRCPTSPIIPEEDDVLDMLSVEGSDGLSTHSGNSSCGFSSDSASSSSTDHGCEMPKPIKSPVLQNNSKSCDALQGGLKLEFKIIKNVHNDSEASHEESIERLLGDSDIDSRDMDSVDSDNHLTANMYTQIEHNQRNPLQLPIVDELRQRSLSNETEHTVLTHNALSSRERNSISSQSTSISSCVESSESSDWDAEVREEERLANGYVSESLHSEMSDSECSELATSSDTMSECDYDLNKINIKRDSISLEQSHTQLKHIYESESEKESDNDLNNITIEKKGHTSVRPQSTPFRSSRGTAVFLSHIKSSPRFADQMHGNLNLNELINATKTEMNNNNVSQQMASIKPHHSTPMKMKKNKKKRLKAIQKRKNATVIKV